jgi:Raf kinase inhibitor-like YbhB/YbcL family protein
MKMFALRTFAAALAVVLLAACVGLPAEVAPDTGPLPGQDTQEETPVDEVGVQGDDVEAVEEGEEHMPFELESSAFGYGEPIPQQYTCDGEDISPPLSWSDPPEETWTYALIMDDPDAPSGDWVHWLFYNLPREARGLQAGVVPSERELEGMPEDEPGVMLHGVTSWEMRGYRGPCPPSGTHRYYFRLYALDTILDLPSGATRQELTEAMEGHILAVAELMGTYSRSR